MNGAQGALGGDFSSETKLTLETHHPGPAKRPAEENLPRLFERRSILRHCAFRDYLRIRRERLNATTGTVRARDISVRAEG